MSFTRTLVAALAGAVLVLSALPADAQRSAAERNRERERQGQQKEAPTKAPEVSKSGRVYKKTSASQKFNRGYQKAIKHYEADEFDDAIATLESLRDPKNSAYELAKIAQMSGYSHYQEDRLDDAIAAFRAALAADGLDNIEHFAVMLTLAEVLHMNDQLSESIEVFQEWLKDAERVSGRNWIVYAKNYFDQDDYENALQYIDMAFASGDTPERAWYQMKANCLLSLERTDEAIAFGREVMAQTPDDPEFANFLSALQIDAERPQEAVDFLEDMRARGQLARENLWVNLYRAYRDLEKPALAAAAIREGIEKGIVADSRERLMLVGEGYYDSEDLPNALDYFRRAAAKSSDDGTADLYAGQVLLDQEKPREAREAIAAAIQKGNLRQPGNAYYQLGVAELDSGNEAAAVAAFEKAKGYPESSRNATQALRSMGR